MKYGHALVQLLCKAPTSGEVKTRLAAYLGEDGAAALHLELATDAFNRCRASTRYKLDVWCAPTIDHQIFGSFADSGADLFEQVGHDLATRMQHAMSQGLLVPGVNKVVLIGTDCPSINASYIELALDALGDHDVVFGPAEDGGYGLIGMKHAVVASVFQGIRWGTNSVLADSCRKLNDMQINFALLPLIWDVDIAEDLPRYRAWLDARSGKPKLD